MIDYSRLPQESEYEYVYRIGSMKAEIGTWQDVTTLLNGELNYEYTESRYRKMYQALDRMTSAARADQNAKPFADLTRQRLEIEKQRIRMRDERNEMSRAIRQQARADSLLDMIHEALASSVPPMSANIVVPEIPDGDCGMIVHLTDVHGGLKTQNFANQYSPEIMRSRLGKYAAKIGVAQNTHQATACAVVLGGDLISGIIHSNLRLENTLNLVQQVMDVSAALCEFIDAICGYFPAVHIYSVPGNHSRCLPRKEDNVKGENLDCLIFWYMQAALKGYPNIVFHENDIEESVAIFELYGNTVYCVHGDKDSASSVVQNLSMFFHQKPDIVMMGHRHTNGMTTVYDTKVIESGCISGPDNFCMDHRLRNKPEQSIVIVDERGVDCVYNVVLD